jgi:hypothetical protein
MKSTTRAIALDPCERAMQSVCKLRATRMRWVGGVGVGPQPLPLPLHAGGGRTMCKGWDVFDVFDVLHNNIVGDAHFLLSLQKLRCRRVAGIAGCRKT